jgi:8-oxo-dGTP pyrophosphatase MutT (NUDIX family)
MLKKYRKSVFLVVYCRIPKLEYLVLKRKLHWKGWEFPKGGMEKSETIRQTIIRELSEETGLEPIKIKRHNKTGKFKYDSATIDERGFIGQSFELYSAEVSKGKVKIDLREHSGFKWVDFDKALDLLTWKNQKQCLKIVNSWVSGRQP